MIRAMLEAYKRTLEKTMAQARSMEQVVVASAIPLIESPDDAVAWGVALGLQDEVQRVLERTAEDVQAGQVVVGLRAALVRVAGQRLLVRRQQRRRRRRARA